MISSSHSQAESTWTGPPAYMVKQLLLLHARLPLERIQLRKDIPLLHLSARAGRYLAILSSGSLDQWYSLGVFWCSISFTSKEIGDERIERVVAIHLKVVACACQSPSARIDPRTDAYLRTC